MIPLLQKYYHMIIAWFNVENENHNTEVTQYLSCNTFGSLNATCVDDVNMVSIR